MEKILGSKFWLFFLLLILIGINFLASNFHSRFDLTKEKRYTLNKASKDIFRNLDDNIQIEIFFKGSYPAGFRKLVTNVQEFLQECQEYTHGKMKVTYS